MPNDAVPSTQAAWVVNGNGLPKDVVSVVQDHPVPKQFEPDQVLIKVDATGINPGDLALMTLPSLLGVSRPYVAASDFAGTVVDPNGSSFSKGDSVFGTVALPDIQKSKQGSLTEYIAVRATNVNLRPPNVPIIQAAGAGVAGFTAYQAVYDICKVEAGQTIFVYGASSSIGSLIVMMAKALGARVVASASGKNEAHVRKMGADEFLDYTQAPIHEQLTKSPPSPKFHAIFDAVGIWDPTFYNQSPNYLAPNGIFCWIGSKPTKADTWNVIRMLSSAMWPRWLGGTPRKYHNVLALPKREVWEGLVSLLASGQIKIPIDSVHSFEDVYPAFERQRSKRATGKIIVIVNKDLNETVENDRA